MTTETAKATAYDFSIASLCVKSEVINGRVYWYGDNSDNLSTRFEKTSRGCGRRAKTVGNPWKRISKAAAAEILAKYSITLEQFRAYENGEHETAAQEVVNSEAQETVDTAAEVSESAPKTVEQAKSTIEFCEYAFRNMDLSDEAFDKCLAEYKAAKTVIDNAAKIAELKAEHDKVTEKMYADETSEATARRLRATRREIREEIKALETEQEVTEPELTASMKLAAEIIASVGEGEVKFSHAGEGKNGGLALHYDLDDGSEFGTGISLVEVFTDKTSLILDHVNVIKLNPVKTVKTYNFIQPVDPAPTDESTDTPEENVETSEQVTEGNVDETPAAGISPDEKLAELVNAAKTAWEAQRDKSFNSTQAEAFRASKKAITKFLDTTRGALSTETLLVADNWRESEFSGSSDLPSFVIKNLKTGKPLGTYNTLAEVKAALEGKQVAELPKFEAGKTYFDTWSEDTGRPHTRTYTVVKRTAKTIVLKSGARCRIVVDENCGEIAKVGYGTYLYAKDIYGTDAIKKQAKSDKYWDETEREIDRRARERKALALADKIARDFQGDDEPSVLSLLPALDSLRDVDNTRSDDELKAAPENNVPQIVDEFSAKESELKENIGFALDAAAVAAAKLVYAKIAYDNAQFQFSVAEDIKIQAEQSYREFVFGEASRLNSLPIVNAVCNACDLCLTVVFDVKTQLFKIEHGIAAVAGAKIILGAFKTPAQVETFLLSLLPADDDTPPAPADDDGSNVDVEALAAMEHIENGFEDLRNFIEFVGKTAGLTVAQCEAIYAELYRDCNKADTVYDDEFYARRDSLIDKYKAQNTPPITIDPLAEIDVDEYATNPDALTLAVYEEEGQAYIARCKREILADAQLAKAYAKAKKIVNLKTTDGGYPLEWQARKKNGEWSRNEFYAKRRLRELGIDWLAFITFHNAQVEETKAFRAKAPDSLARAMETALLKVQEHCLRHDLKAAQREMAVYGICSEALATLGKEV